MEMNDEHVHFFALRIAISSQPFEARYFVPEGFFYVRSRLAETTIF